MIVGILLFQAVAFAVLSGIVADKKSRDVTKWSIIGFLFGIFGFIAALIVGTAEPEDGGAEKKQPSEKSRRQPRKTQKFNPDNHEKKCPDCAEYIKLEARVCRYCGHEFSDEEVANAVEKERRQFLGSSLSDDVDEMYCHFCGEVAKENHAQSPYWTCEDCADDVPIS